MKEVTYISVILPLRLEWEPCYSIDSDIDIRTGDRIKVDFAGKEYHGVVSEVGISPETDRHRIKPVTEIISGMSRILPEEIHLWRKVAEYYMCTIGEVYKAAYPVSKVNMEEAHAAAVLKTAQRRERMLDAMRAKVSRLQERLARKEEMAAGSREGTKARARYTEEAGRIRKDLELASSALEVVETGTPRSGAENEIPEWTGVTLSDAQKRAYDHIAEAMKNGKPVLLHGVTGSGKTEIYIKAAQDALSKGGNILYLVPEIALSRQLEDRLYAHFGKRLMTFHSAETAAGRRATAEAIRNGNGYIILGTRSSLFLPHHDLGLIIVDEEHDSSYKQDSPAPRYNGRDTALMLSTIHHCGIILGSATPSLEEMYNCECGRHILVELNEKFHQSGNAALEIIDTRAERKKRGMSGNFSRKLIEHVSSTLRQGGQVMMLIARRSWAPAVQCEECGEIQKCPHCNVSLNLHKSGDRETLLCHYCGYAQPHSGRCLKCGGALKSLGAGTQKIEEEAAALFPEARIARLDSDTAQNKAYETQVIRDFGKGNIDILIGTQMLAKGFDFAGLRLVAVIAADTFLGIQDFRADEKAYQMLEQFRGRCGRRNENGTFVIQTSQPEHPVYKMIGSGNGRVFSTEFLLERKSFDFPPYTRLIEISIKDRFEDRAQRMASELTGMLRDSFNVTGPYQPSVDKVADRHIRSIRINLKKDRMLSANKESIRQIISAFEKSRRYDGHITVNVDPA